jgi:cyclase
MIPSWPTELRRLAPNVYAYTQASGPGVDNASLSNAGVIEGPDGLLAIDTLGPPIHAKAFKAAAEAATRKRFGRVINTHHHRDHTNGNCFFAPVEIVSSAYTRQATIDDGIPARPTTRVRCGRPGWGS